MIDVMIITFNESLNLPHCLAALRGWTNKVFVIDSGSTDGTPEIGREAGVEVVHHDWEGYARQKNWALRNLPFESDWILIVDADEVITEGVRERLLEIASRPTDEVEENGFFINRITYFLGRPIRHCGYFPSWNLRFFKRDKGFYEDRQVHEHVVIDDPVGYVREAMIHDDRRGLEHYIAKHNRYSTLEARALFAEATGHDAGGGPEANLSRDTQRRRWIKRYVLPRVPLPWLWRFLYMSILRGGILDGTAGLEFCKFISVYDYMVAMKYRALRRAASRGIVAEELVVPAKALAMPEGDDPVVAAATLAAAPPPAPPEAGAAPVAPPRPARPVRHVEPTDFTVDGPPVPVSVVVLTMNEEINIEPCLESCRWCDDVHVVDSGSTDRTKQIARDMDAEVHHHAFESFGAQRNWAIDNVPMRHEWVFHLDADERFTPELVEQMKRLVASDPAESGFYVPNKLILMGRWLRRSGGYPTYQMRLFHRGRMRFCDYGHGQREQTRGEVGTLDEPYLHYAFSKGLSDWFAKHNRYSTLEAQQVLALAQRAWSWSDLFFAGRVDRRRAWKEASYKLPFRARLRWLFMLLLQGGLLEGKAGRTYARMMAIYEQMISLKLRQMREGEAIGMIPRGEGDAEENVESSKRRNVEIGAVDRT